MNRHTFLVGTDEAGYGPNLGPLVISATVWEAPEGLRAEALDRRLEGVVARSAAEASAAGPGCVAIADSKTLYPSGKGLALLERGLLAALAVLGRRPRSWRETWEALAPGSAPARAAIPWYADYDAAVPIDCGPAEIEVCAGALGDGLARTGVRLVEVRSRAIHEGEFNALCRRHGSKGAVLSHATLALAAEAIAPLEGTVLVVCDKHGGRDRYGPLLGEHFPGPLIEVCGEGRQQSVYRFGPPERRVEFRFQAKGESHLPTALASMASKYLRELAMRALNDFWRRRVPCLTATAGYPADARRFKADIASAQAALGIDDDALWRSK